jgi:hypothetical protein
VNKGKAGFVAGFFYLMYRPDSSGAAVYYDLLYKGTVPEDIGLQKPSKLPDNRYPEPSLCIVCFKVLNRLRIGELFPAVSICIAGRTGCAERGNTISPGICTRSKQYNRQDEEDHFTHKVTISCDHEEIMKRLSVC